MCFWSGYCITAAEIKPGHLPTSQLPNKLQPLISDFFSIIEVSASLLFELWWSWALGYTWSSCWLSCEWKSALSERQLQHMSLLMLACLMLIVLSSQGKTPWAGNGRLPQGHAAGCRTENPSSGHSEPWDSDIVDHFLRGHWRALPEAIRLFSDEARQSLSAFRHVQMVTVLGYEAFLPRILLLPLGALKQKL